MPKTFVLSPQEVEVLFRQDPATDGDGGWQNLLIGLQRKANRTTAAITLDDADLDRIPRYAFDYGKGGWEERLKAVFGRHLGDSLGRSPA